MKQLTGLLSAFAVLLISSCQKNARETLVPAANNANTNIAEFSKGGGGGDTATTGFISSVGGTFKLIGGNSDSIQINLSQASQAGWALGLASSDAAFQIPSTFSITPGTFNVHVPITSSVITAAKTVVVTASLFGQSVSSFPFKIFPLHYTFPAPQLQSPGNGAGFKNRLQVKFIWSDNGNAYYHDIQISDDPAFATTPMLEVYVNDPVWAASYFNGLGKRYWRVRYIDGSGTPGPGRQLETLKSNPDKGKEGYLRRW